MPSPPGPIVWPQTRVELSRTTMEWQRGASLLGVVETWSHNSRSQPGDQALLKPRPGDRSENGRCKTNMQIRVVDPNIVCRSQPRCIDRCTIEKAEQMQLSSLRKKRSKSKTVGQFRSQEVDYWKLINASLMLLL